MEADSDIMIAVFNPQREKLKKYRSYNIELLPNVFRSIILLKNRYGDGDIAIGCNFFGKSNYWRELPRGEEIYDYEYYTDVMNYFNNDSIDNSYEEKIEENNENEKIINNLNIIL